MIYKYGARRRQALTLISSHYGAGDAEDNPESSGLLSLIVYFV